MAGIIIHTTNKKDLSLLQHLADKMGLKANVFEDSEEDNIIGKAIQENDPSDLLALKEAKEYYESLKQSDK